MKAVVLRPWRDDGCEWRRLSHRVTGRRLRDKGFEMIEASDPTPGPLFSRNAALNAAASQAWSRGADVVLLADTDTEVPTGQLRQACAATVETGRPVMAFTHYIRVRSGPTEKILKPRKRPTNWRRVAQKKTRFRTGWPSGALAVTREIWATVGGFDERFTSWGCGDIAFLLSCETLVGDLVRIDGEAWHWWHPPRVTDGRNNIDPVILALFLRYREAGGIVAPSWPEVAWPDEGPDLTPGRPRDREAMLAILSEPGGPLADRRRGSS